MIQSAMTLRWVEDPETDEVWHTTCGRYHIIGFVLPERRKYPTTVYMLRKIDPQTMAAIEAGDPTYQGSLGYFVGLSYGLDEAQAEAERDAWVEAYADERSRLPDDYPAVDRAPFFFPISNGTDRAWLTLERNDGALVARVVSMSRRGDACEPGVYVELPVTVGSVPPGVEMIRECHAQFKLARGSSDELASLLEAAGWSRPMARKHPRVRIYFDRRDWWIGIYNSKRHVYICPLPTLVIRLRKKRARS